AANVYSFSDEATYVEDIIQVWAYTYSKYTGEIIDIDYFIALYRRRFQFFCQQFTPLYFGLDIDSEKQTENDGLKEIIHAMLERLTWIEPEIGIPSENDNNHYMTGTIKNLFSFLLGHKDSVSGVEAEEA